MCYHSKAPIPNPQSPSPREYLRVHPEPPVAPGEALVIDVDAWTSSTSCYSDGSGDDSHADSASDTASGSSPARSDFTVEEAGLFF